MGLIGKSMGNQSNYLAIDVGGSFIKYGIVSKEYEIISKFHKRTIQFNDIDTFLDYILEGINDDFSAICISIPGIIKENRYIASSPGGKLNALHKIDLAKELEYRIKIPVFVCNDGVAAAICEHEIGTGKGSSHFVMLTIGTALGGAVYIDGKLYRGIDDVVGEFSGIPISYNDDGTMCRLASICSINRLLHNYNLVSGNNNCDAKTIINLARDNDILANEILNDWCKNIVIALSILALCYNPQIICVGGGISANDWFFSKLTTIYKNAPTPFGGRIKTQIMNSTYRNDANLLGAILAYKGFK